MSDFMEMFKAIVKEEPTNDTIETFNIDNELYVKQETELNIDCPDIKAEVTDEEEMILGYDDPNLVKRQKISEQGSSSPSRKRYKTFADVVPKDNKCSMCQVVFVDSKTLKLHRCKKQKLQTLPDEPSLLTAKEGESSTGGDFDKRQMICDEYSQAAFRARRAKYMRYYRLSRQEGQCKQTAVQSNNSHKGQRGIHIKLYVKEESEIKTFDRDGTTDSQDIFRKKPTECMRNFIRFRQEGSIKEKTQDVHKIGQSEVMIKPEKEAIKLLTDSDSQSQVKMSNYQCFILEQQANERASKTRQAASRAMKAEYMRNYRRLMRERRIKDEPVESTAAPTRLVHEKRHANYVWESQDEIQPADPLDTSRDRRVEYMRNYRRLMRDRQIKEMLGENAASHPRLVQKIRNIQVVGEAQNHIRRDEPNNSFHERENYENKSESNTPDMLATQALQELEDSFGLRCKKPDEGRKDSLRENRAEYMRGYHHKIRERQIKEAPPQYESIKQPFVTDEDRQAVRRAKRAEYMRNFRRLKLARQQEESQIYIRRAEPNNAFNVKRAEYMRNYRRLMRDRQNNEESVENTVSHARSVRNIRQLQVVRESQDYIQLSDPNNSLHTRRAEYMRNYRRLMRERQIKPELGENGVQKIWNNKIVQKTQNYMQRAELNNSFHERHNDENKSQIADTPGMLDKHYTQELEEDSFGLNYGNPDVGRHDSLTENRTEYIHKHLCLIRERHTDKDRQAARRAKRAEYMRNFRRLKLARKNEEMATKNRIVHTQPIRKIGDKNESEENTIKRYTNPDKDTMRKIRHIQAAPESQDYIRLADLDNSFCARRAEYMRNYLHLIQRQ